jgi:hypothetical protein
VLAYIVSQSDSCDARILLSKSLKLADSLAVVRREVVNKDEFIAIPAETVHLSYSLFDYGSDSMR